MAEQSQGLLSASDDTVLNFGEEDELNSQKKKNFKYPGVVFFTVMFRASAIVLYLFAGILGVGFITSFVLIMLLLSADFWTIKNVSGRLLAGVRWWNYVDDDGNSHWVYEARKNPISNADSSIFWFSLILGPFLWVLFFFTSLLSLSLNWLMIVCIALVLNGSNLYGYVRCKLGKGNVLPSAAGYFRDSIVSNVLKVFVPSQQQSNPFTATRQQV